MVQSEIKEQCFETVMYSDRYTQRLFSDMPGVNVFSSTVSKQKSGISDILAPVSWPLSLFLSQIC